LFTREAVVLIQEYSHGIPRTISVICDNALLSGFAAGRQPVSRDVVEEVARDFDLARGVAVVAKTVVTPGSLETPEQPAPAPALRSVPSVAAPGEPPERPMFSEPDRPRRFSLFGRS
jgi:hypothetical protein